MATMPRVALVASSYHPHVGGVETHVRAVAAALAARGHPVEVWTVDRDGRQHTEEVDGIRVRNLPAPLPSGSASGVRDFLRSAPRALAAWGSAARAFSPQVIHVQCFGPNGVYALVLSRLTRLPLVVSSHGETLADDGDLFTTSRQVRAALRLSLRAAHTVTGVSQAVVDDLRDRFGAPQAVVVPNGIDVLPTSPSTPRRPGLVVGVGRLEHNKGFDLLIRAMARPEVPASAELVIAGDGGARTDIEALMAELGLTERVELLGTVSTDGVAALLARASAVVVPSRWEAFGIVALEAWRAGAPLVVTSRGGPPSFVTDGVDGLLVDPEYVGALAGALGRVLTEPGLGAALGAAGTERVASFSWARVVDQYEQIYRAASALRAPRSPRGQAV